MAATSLDTFAVCPGVSCGVSDDLEKARMPIEMNMALYTGSMDARDNDFYNDHAKRLGAAEAAMRIQDRFPAGRKAEELELLARELL